MDKKIKETGVKSIRDLIKNHQVKPAPNIQKDAILKPPPAKPKK